jgi:hypothetical protein
MMGRGVAAVRMKARLCGRFKHIRIAHSTIIGGYSSGMTVRSSWSGKNKFRGTRTALNQLPFLFLFLVGLGISHAKWTLNGRTLYWLSSEF